MRSNYNYKFFANLNDSAKAHYSVTHIITHFVRIIAPSLHYFIVNSECVLYDLVMKKNVLSELLQEFAVEVITVARILKEKGERGFADQIKRSGMSISTNIAAGNYPQSRADKISKFEIALKEANETEDWLNILKIQNLLMMLFLRPFIKSW